jgi:hypothetical protein
MIWIGNKASTQVVNGQKYKEIEGGSTRLSRNISGQRLLSIWHLLIASFRLEIACSPGNMGHPHYWHNDDLLKQLEIL